MSRMLTDLADVARGAGLKVEEVSGWRTRGRSAMRGVNAVVCHHTAGPAHGNYPSLRIVRDGRPDLPGPLCNLGVARDGTVLVVAAGRANHAGGYYAPGDHRNTTKAAYQNDLTIGIEAEATGVDTWPEVQLDAYARLCAALVDHYRLSIADVVGHKESCQPVGRKSDPNFDMNDFRRRVAAAHAEEAPMTPSEKQRMQKLEDKVDELHDLLSGDGKGAKWPDGKPGNVLTRVAGLIRKASS